MQLDLVALGLDALPVALEPGLQILLTLRQPAGLAQDVEGMRAGRHGGTLPALTQIASLALGMAQNAGPSAIARMIGR